MLCTLVLHHCSQKDPWCTTRLKSGDHLQSELPPNPQSPNVFRNAEIVERAVSVDENAPISILNRTICVSHDARLKFRNEHDRLGPRDLFTQPPLVAMLDILEHKKSLWIGFVVYPHDYRSEGSSGWNVGGSRVADDGGRQLVR